MSHGDHQLAAQLIDCVRKVAYSRNRLCPIILDTKGPEIRVAWIAKGEDAIELESGDAVFLLTGQYSYRTKAEAKSLDVDTETKAVAVSYPFLTKSVREGDVVLLDDGRISLIVTKVASEDKVMTQVIEGGRLLHNKGVNLPGWYACR